jgi:predicted ATPase
MTLPNATIFQFGENIEKVNYEETEHFSILKNFLNNPEAFLRHL